MNIKFEPCMKRMKISHIMRKYSATKEQAIALRGGESIKDTPVTKPVKIKTTSIKESNNG